MWRRAWVVVPLMVLGGVLVTIAALVVAPSVANATPGFARQTGLSCEACHTVFPELTPFGRKFKLNAYVFTNVKQLEAINEQRESTFSLSDLPPISVQLQASNTTLGSSIPDTPATGDLAQRNTTQFPQALSLFYTGKVAPLLGAFLQLTWTPPTNSVGIDNSDLRFANHAAFESIRVPDFIYGITLNNNPTSQDIWNSTPAWTFPFIATNVGVPPVTKALLNGQLSQESVGLGAYLFLYNHLYLELSGYRAAPTHFTNATTGGPGPLDSTTPSLRISGVAAPYWRAAWEQDWGKHALSFGTYGISAETLPTGVGKSGPTNNFLDIGLDAQYQYISDNHLASFYTTVLRENRVFNNTTMAANLHNHIITFTATGSYFYRRMIGGSVQFFSTTGPSDQVLYATGTPVLGSGNGMPDTKGATFELDYLPWLNTKLGVQYTLYTKFNGNSKNYDGFGRNASGNNTLFVFLWLAF